MAQDPEQERLDGNQLKRKAPHKGLFYCHFVGSVSGLKRGLLTKIKPHQFSLSEELGYFCRFVKGLSILHILSEFLLEE